MASVTINPSSSSMTYSINTNFTCSGTSLSSIHPSYVIACVIAVVSCILGIPTNILMIVKLSSHLRGSSMTKRLIFNLALSDLLSLFCLVIAGAILANRPLLTHELCQFFFYILLFSITSSSNILLLISVQRFYQILRNDKWKKVTRTWQRVLLFTVWMLGALLSLCLVLSLTERVVEDKECQRRSCRNKQIAPEAELIYIVISVSSQLVVLVFYIKLVKGVKNVHMSDKKKQKINRLFSRILAVSLMDFLPLCARLVAVAAHFTGSNMLSDFNIYVTPIEYLYFLNHCLNPLLFFFSSRHQLRDRNKRRRLFLMALNDSC